jgi:hypothetical protein
LAEPIEHPGTTDTTLTQEAAESEDKVKFPKRIKHRGKVLATNRRNGLRHAFVSAHFAAYSDENLTAAQAGNSPQMIHAHYKGLLTKAEGEAWFAVAPAKAANVIPLPAVSRTEAH